MDGEGKIEKLIVRYRHTVQHIARRYFPDKANDEDLLQCGLIGLWEAARDWNQKGDFQAFANRCVYNNMCDYLRAEGNVPPPVEPREDDEVEEQDAFDHIHLMERIKSRWGENSRERYILTALASGISIMAVAASLGISVQTVRTIAERAWEGIQKEDGE
jgi:RNA polymerase sigma factor (sigma-70 family)